MLGISTEISTDVPLISHGASSSSSPGPPLFACDAGTKKWGARSIAYVIAPDSAALDDTVTQIKKSVTNERLLASTC